MSVISRFALAGALCAALGAQAFAAPVGDDPGTTKGRFFHAGKCVVTLGFSGGCDKDEADANRRVAEQKQAVEHPEKVKVVDTTSTRHQFMRASKCVVSLGFAGNCDKNAPEVAPAERRAEAAARGPDNSTAGQFKHAGACVVSFGFLGDCDKK